MAMVEDYRVNVTGPVFQNAQNRFDVDASGSVDIIDALTILALLQQAQRLGIPTPISLAPPQSLAHPGHGAAAILRR